MICCRIESQLGQGQNNSIFGHRSWSMETGVMPNWYPWILPIVALLLHLWTLIVDYGCFITRNVRGTGISIVRNVLINGTSGTRFSIKGNGHPDTGSLGVRLSISILLLCKQAQETYGFFTVLTIQVPGISKQKSLLLEETPQEPNSSAARGVSRSH